MGKVKVVQISSQDTYVDAMRLLQALLDDLQVDDGVPPLVETLLNKAQLSMEKGLSRDPHRQLARAYRVAEDPWKKRIGEVLLSLMKQSD
jgi:hypothetical protein